MDSKLRIGQGYDVHRLTEGRKLILGGVTIPWDRGLLGHSDADVLVHAVMDALLGAAALGDIGAMFPDTDPRFAGADSLILLRAVCDRLSEEGWRIVNVDSTIVAQKPKLSPYIPEMRRRMAEAMGVAVDRISVKATTEECLGFTGRGEGMSAIAVALLEGRKTKTFPSHRMKRIHPCGGIFMSAIVLFRSLLQAQRGGRALARVGIPANVVKAPRAVEENGCAYGVRFSEKWLSEALRRLAEQEISHGRVYRTGPDGELREVLP